MKQIFDWLREQIKYMAINVSPNTDKLLTLYKVELLINEAEAKWEKEHKSYDVEKVVEQIHDYFCKVIDDCEEDIVPHEILEYNKAICEIVRRGGVE